jgi:hypothetical protein
MGTHRSARPVARSSRTRRLDEPEPPPPTPAANALSESALEARALEPPSERPPEEAAPRPPLDLEESRRALEARKVEWLKFRERWRRVRNATAGEPEGSEPRTEPSSDAPTT